MSKQENNENIFWIFCKVIGCIMIAFLIIYTPYQVGKYNAEDMSQQSVLKIERVPTEPCEYKTIDFYYKGSCDATDMLLRLDERERRFEEERKKALEDFNKNRDKECIKYPQQTLIYEMI